MQVSQQLHRAAGTDTTVLLEGESGTGKELFARALHALSNRSDGPFVAINCAAIRDAARDGAVRPRERRVHCAAARKPGRFELAHRGTLFLDEIGDLPLVLAGENSSRARREAIRARWRHPVAPRRRARGRGHQPVLKAAVAAKQFREDLYFRLSVFPISIPRCANDPATSQHWRGTSSTSSPAT